MTMALEGGEGSVSCPGCSLPWQRPGTHCTGSWVGPRAGLDRCGKSRPNLYCTFLHGELHTHAQQVGIYRHNTDNAHIHKHSGTKPVILARHWLWLPDDGSCM